MVEEAVKTVINEIGDTHRGQYMIGRASARADRNGKYDSLAQNYHKGQWNPNGDFEQGYDNQGEYEDTKKRGGVLSIYNEIK